MSTRSYVIFSTNCYLGMRIGLRGLIVGYSLSFTLPLHETVALAFPFLSEIGLLA